MPEMFPSIGKNACGNCLFGLEKTENVARISSGKVLIISSTIA